MTNIWSVCLSRLEIRNKTASPDRISVYDSLAEVGRSESGVGFDIALEALREAWNCKRAMMDELWRYAEICGMVNVMRLYLEAVSVA